MQTLALIPGMLCDARLWRAQTPLLNHYQIQIPDLALMEDIPSIASQLIDSLPETFTLGGLSMGGYIALEMYRQLLEAGEAHRVEKLLLIATSARSDTAEHVRVRKGFIALARLGKFKGVTPKLLPTLIHPSRVEEAEITDVIFDMADAVGLEAFIRQEAAVMNRYDQLAILPRVTCPTFILCGEDDQRTPLECSEEMRGLIPQANLHVLKECGHLPPLEKPEETGRLMAAFLT